MSKTASNFLGTSVSSVLIAVLTFLSGVLIARGLGPEDRAVYGTILIFCQLISNLGCLSFFEGAIILFRNKGAEIESYTSSMILASAALGSLSLTFGLIAFISFLDLGANGMSTMEIVTILAGIVFFELVWQMFSAGERSQMKFLLVNVARVAAPASFSLLIVLIWLWQGERLTTWVVLMLFLVSKLPVLAFWLWRYARHSGGPISTTFLRDAGAIGLRLHMAVAVAAVAAQLDRLIAIGAWSNDLLGQYFVAFSAVGAGYAVITSAVNTVLFPYLAGMEAAERQERVHLILRLTVLISGAAALVGLCILPFAIPLLYGADYLAATPMAMGLLGALAVLPIRAVVLEAGRSLGKGRASVEMALVSIAVMLGLYGLTGFATPTQLIVSLGLANLLSMLAGARHLVRDGVIRPGRHLLPDMVDVRRLLSILKKRRAPRCR